MENGRNEINGGHEMKGKQEAQSKRLELFAVCGVYVDEFLFRYTFVCVFGFIFVQLLTIYSSQHNWNKIDEAINLVTVRKQEKISKSSSYQWKSNQIYIIINIKGKIQENAGGMIAELR